MREDIVEFLLHTPQGTLWREDPTKQLHGQSDAQILELLPGGRPISIVPGDKRHGDTWASADSIEIISMLYQIEIECLILTPTGLYRAF